MRTNCVIVNHDSTASECIAVHFTFLLEVGLKSLALTGAADIVVELIGIGADIIEQCQIPFLLIQRPRRRNTVTMQWTAVLRHL